MLKREPILKRDNSYRFKIITNDTDSDSDVVGFNVYVEMVTPEGIKKNIIYATTPQKAQRMLEEYKRDRGIK